MSRTEFKPTSDNPNFNQ